MFREQPLTWLFIVATIVIDLVLASTVPAHFSLGLELRLGFILGQLVALAIWVVRGKMHRLARVSFLVITIGLLACYVEIRSDQMSTWFGFLSTYALIIVLTTIASDFLQKRFRDPLRDDEVSKRWQISLIELFGWSIVVAIISFGFRHMDFDFLEKDALLSCLAFLSVPILVVTLIRRDIRDLRSISALVIVFATIASAIYIGSRTEGGGVFVIFVQTAYLILSLAVVGMDAIHSAALEVQKSLQINNSPATKVKLFNPDE